MSKSLISSFLVSDVSESLRSLTKNERPCAIRSGRSEKWAIVSEVLKSLTKNEQMSESLIFLSEKLISSFLGKKQVIRSENRWANSQPCLQTTWNFFWTANKQVFSLNIENPIILIRKYGIHQQPYPPSPSEYRMHLLGR